MRPLVASAKTPAAPDRNPGLEWIDCAKELLDDVPDKTRKALQFEIACGLRAAHDQGHEKGWTDAVDHLMANAEYVREQDGD